MRSSQLSPNLPIRPIPSFWRQNHTAKATLGLSPGDRLVSTCSREEKITEGHQKPKGKDVLPMNLSAPWLGLIKDAPGQRKKSVISWKLTRCFRNRVPHLAPSGWGCSSHPLLRALLVAKGRVLMRLRCGMRKKGWERSVVFCSFLTQEARNLHILASYMPILNLITYTKGREVEHSRGQAHPTPELGQESSIPNTTNTMCCLCYHDPRCRTLPLWVKNIVRLILYLQIHIQHRSKCSWVKSVRSFMNDYMDNTWHVNTHSLFKRQVPPSKPRAKRSSLRVAWSVHSWSRKWATHSWPADRCGLPWRGNILPQKGELRNLRPSGWWAERTSWGTEVATKTRGAKDTRKQNPWACGRWDQTPAGESNLVALVVKHWSEDSGFTVLKSLNSPSPTPGLWCA